MRHYTDHAKTLWWQCAVASPIQRWLLPTYGLRQLAVECCLQHHLVDYCRNPVVKVSMHVPRLHLHSVEIIIKHTLYQILNIYQMFIHQHKKLTKVCGLSPRVNYTARSTAKLVPTFADRGSHVVSTMDLQGCILASLDRSRYYFFQIAPQLYSRCWVDTIPSCFLWQIIFKQALIWTSNPVSWKLVLMVN
jgi:hypothetical protein